MATAIATRKVSKSSQQEVKGADPHFARLTSSHRRLLIFKADEAPHIADAGDDEVLQYWRSEIRPHSGHPNGSDHHLGGVVDIRVMRRLLDEAKQQPLIRAAPAADPT